LLDHFIQLITIVTPAILLTWFYYSQKQILSKNYYEEIIGTYAGFTLPTHELKDKITINAGIIMHIREINKDGYFKGEFEFGETSLKSINNIPTKHFISMGIYTFFGKLNFKIKLDKSRHPFKPDQNRIYNGKLYIVTRLDFQFDKYNIEDYLQSEYKIVHYREMQTLSFSLIQKKIDGGQKLPDSFTLYKSVGFSFDPLKGVKDVVFTDVN